MKTAIIKGLTEQHAEEVRGAFIHSAVLRQQLVKLLQEKINASNRNTRSKDAYGIPNWAYLQADAVGYERALVEVINLLTTEEPTVTPTADATPKRRGRPPKKNILNSA